MTTSPISHWLQKLGIAAQGTVSYNADRSLLVTEALRQGEGNLSHTGALVVETTPYTGRSPDDKYIVDYKDREDLWWGEVNQKITPECFFRLQNRISAYLSNKKLYVIDAKVGSDSQYQQNVRLVTEFAWQALAGQNLFIYNAKPSLVDPDMIILAAPRFNTTPEVDNVRSKAAICIDLREKIVLIAGSKYAGEIKKSAFTIMNAFLPEHNVLPMHCSANMGEDGDVALFFGLSGTGKTTLSSTPDRQLIGDDEHGWGENGVFNFEGGCYAKTIRLKEDLEPVIWSAANQFGSVLENVVLSAEDGSLDFDDNHYTENTRAAYPLSRVENIVPGSQAGHPKNIFFLTADAFGVMPPIAKLTPKQAVFYFLSGYTSKVAGTERGLGKQPIATFSTCFGEPFLPLTPNIYAKLLKEKVRYYQSNIWLINTGWTCGGYNEGSRMPLPYTRKMVSWILSGNYENVTYHQDPVFKITVPDKIPGVPEDFLFPRKTWKNKQAFDETAKKLKSNFNSNFQKFLSYLDNANEQTDIDG